MCVHVLVSIWYPWALESNTYGLHDVPGQFTICVVFFFPSQSLAWVGPSFHDCVPHHWFNLQSSRLSLGSGEMTGKTLFKTCSAEKKREIDWRGYLSYLVLCVLLS